MYIIKINLNGASYPIKLQFNNEKLKEENQLQQHQYKEATVPITNKINPDTKY